MRAGKVALVHRLGLLAGGTALALLAACGEREVILPGERFPVRAPLEDSIPTEDNPKPRAPAAAVAAESRPISLPAAQANADWGQRAGNARHAAPHAALSKAPVAVWSANIGAGNSRRNRISAAPVVAGGRVFAMDAGATVTALSTGGGLLWQADLTAAFDKGGGVSGGGLAADGARVFAATAYGEVVALDAKSGGVIWRQRIDAPAIGAPAIEGGRVYVSGRDGSAWALDAGTGKVVWQVFGAPGKSGWLGAAAPTVGDRVVYFPSNAGDLMAVLKPGGGTPVWHSSAAGKRLGRAYAGSFDITGDAALVGGTLYAGTGAGRTVAIDAGSGQQLWGVNEGAMGPLAVAGGSVFLVNDEARLVRLDAADGSAIWSVEMPYFEAQKIKKRKAIVAHYGPVLAGGRLWVASSDGRLSAFSPTDGGLVYQTEIPGGAAGQPAVAGGVLYVVTTKGQVVAFR
ncbi:PQQ-binding-like beta-propeller repeat protein [Rhodobacter sp. SGA-6-6]|uniref:outer membrane protein assembly factor BamB family protein n=1 Tax=Rhodobacter sp. SGA-6-6 TaxID=2710882 RepID=UPI0013ED36B0|nr:PQQ-binding-like beta-propeller repeat protein [Rhodobacter sp. SGA-6-6]NGM46819.1 PQQ-binding-like beta-propeller repeat protein [Rhodobacter sp. SGA-6-6]